MILQYLSILFLAIDLLIEGKRRRMFGHCRALAWKWCANKPGHHQSNLSRWMAVNRCITIPTTTRNVIPPQPTMMEISDVRVMDWWEQGTPKGTSLVTISPSAYHQETLLPKPCTHTIILVPTACHSNKGPIHDSDFQPQPRCAARSRLRLMVYPHTPRPICSIFLSLY